METIDAKGLSTKMQGGEKMVATGHFAEQPGDTRQYSFRGMRRRERIGEVDEIAAAKTLEAIGAQMNAGTRRGVFENPSVRAPRHLNSVERTG